MLIPHYKLETNPFALEGARPFFSSESMRYMQLNLEHVFAGKLQSLFVSGPAGVGKSALVERVLAARKELQRSWIDARIQTPEALIQKLLRDLGPGDIPGSLKELRVILEAFLKHQVGQGRLSILVVDGLERLPLPVIRELEELWRLRLRHRPLLHCVLITRNEELIANLTTAQQEEGRAKAALLHKRLNGFTLNETMSYIRGCLHGAGCAWVDELFPEETIIDVQGFTQGVVGDVNALCRHALADVAVRGAEFRQPQITRSVLKEAAGRLHLRYDPTPWRQIEERLAPEAVHVSDTSEIRIQEARLVISSGGSIVAEITLDRARIVLGRDDSCDISLDSSYVSRFQNLFMQTGEGWVLFDLNSTNGCFVNGRRVREHRLRDGDLIAVGQHQLRFASSSGGGMEAETHGEETAVNPTPIIGKLA